MRGTNSNHTKVLIDGIDVGDPSNPNASFDFGQLLTQDIQKVEVLRGPQSGLYGSDAIGGVINVITKSGSGPTQVSAGLEGGSFDTFNQTGHVSGSLDQFHYAATVDHLHSGATAVTPLDYLPPGQRRIDNAYDNLTASTKLGFDVTEQFDLGLVARYTDSHLHFTGDNFFNFPSTPDTSQSESTTRQYYTRATAHLVSFGGVLEQTLGAAYDNIKSRDFSPDSAPESSLTGKGSWPLGKTRSWCSAPNISEIQSQCRFPPIRPSTLVMQNCNRVSRSVSTIRWRCATTTMIDLAAR
jgi:vitamin B12 transporter